MRFIPENIWREIWYGLGRTRYRLFLGHTGHTFDGEKYYSVLWSLGKKAIMKTPTHTKIFELQFYFLSFLLFVRIRKSWCLWMKSFWQVMMSCQVFFCCLAKLTSVYEADVFKILPRFICENVEKSEDNEVLWVICMGKYNLQSIFLSPFTLLHIIIERNGDVFSFVQLKMRSNRMNIRFTFRMFLEFCNVFANALGWMRERLPYFCVMCVWVATNWRQKFYAFSQQQTEKLRTGCCRVMNEFISPRNKRRNKKYWFSFFGLSWKFFESFFTQRTQGFVRKEL